MRAAALVTALWLGLAACGPSPASPDQTTGPGPVPTGQTSTTLSAGDPPPVFVGSGFEGTALYDTHTGQPLETVPIGPGGHGGPPRITVTADREVVYASTEVTSCSAELYRARPGEDSATRIGQGWFPAVTPDGSRLAYVQAICPGESLEVVIRDLADGEERSWFLTPAEEDELTVGSLAWDARGELLAVEVRHHRGEPHHQIRSEIRILHPARHGSLDEAPTLEPATEGAEWRTPTFRGARGTLVATEVCCAGSAERIRVVEVDPESGAVLGAIFEADRIPVDLDFDASGEHLLYVVDHAEHDEASVEPRAALRWSPGEGAHHLVDELFRARW